MRQAAETGYGSDGTLSPTEEALKNDILSALVGGTLYALEVLAESREPFPDAVLCDHEVIQAVDKCLAYLQGNIEAFKRAFSAEPNHLISLHTRLKEKFIL